MVAKDCVKKIIWFNKDLILPKRYLEVKYQDFIFDSLWSQKLLEVPYRV
jgi:hypothetical protein